MQITKNATKTLPGPREWFSGDVFIDTVAAPTGPSRLGAAMVHFTPGARTAWHTHPFGQTIYITEGVGGASAAAGRSRRSAPATVSSSSPARSTGTALRPTAS